MAAEAQATEVEASLTEVRVNVAQADNDLTTEKEVFALEKNSRMKQLDN
jgi:hypothetical protein